MEILNLFSTPVYKTSLDFKKEKMIGYALKSKQINMGRMLSNSGGWQSNPLIDKIDLFDDIFLKKYTIQLIKKQWGTNLSKFQGVAMLGGVQMNGEQIYSQAQEELNKLEEQIQLSYELPPNYMMG